MEILTFIVVALVSSLAALLWETTRHVYPAYRRAKIQESLATLAKCLKYLNQDAMISGKISSGHYLHDRFYKLMFLVLTSKINLKVQMLTHLKYSEESETQRKNFRREIDKLDKQTAAVINDALFAIAKILALRNPVLFMLFSLRARRESNKRQIKPPRKYLRNKMMNSTEFITVNARKDDDYVFVPC